MALYITTSNFRLTREIFKELGWWFSPQTCSKSTVENFDVLWTMQKLAELGHFKLQPALETHNISGRWKVDGQTDGHMKLQWYPSAMTVKLLTTIYGNKVWNHLAQWE